MASEEEETAITKGSGGCVTLIGGSAGLSR